MALILSSPQPWLPFPLTYPLSIRSHITLSTNEFALSRRTYESNSYQNDMRTQHCKHAAASSALIAILGLPSAKIQCADCQLSTESDQGYCACSTLTSIWFTCGLATRAVLAGKTRMSNPTDQPVKSWQPHSPRYRCPQVSTLTDCGIVCVATYNVTIRITTWSNNLGWVGGRPAVYRKDPVTHEGVLRACGAKCESGHGFSARGSVSMALNGKIYRSRLAGVQGL